MQSHLINTGNGGESVASIPGGMPSRSILGTDAGEPLTGGNTNDRILGNGGNDTIVGLSGSDVLFGNQGNDLVFGNAANDTIYGGQNNDTLYGGRDRDFLSGDRGSDFVSGDLGDDTIIGTIAARGDPNQIEIDTLVGGDGQDVFVLGEDRQIFYQDIDIVSGDQFTTGLSSYAIITDFNANVDQVQLSSQTSYVFGSDPINNSGDLALFIDISKDGLISDRDDLVAIFNGINSSDLIIQNLVFI